MIKLAVIGDPISHSLSPVIHSTVMKNLGLEYEYKSFKVEKGNLKGFINTAKTEKLSGFNVTMPHKVDIIQFLDYIDPEAELHNSVNTVKIENEKLYGYSTDADGFNMSLLESGKDFFAENVLILGCGGACNTIALKAALENAAKVTILNRTESKAKDVCEYISTKLSCSSGKHTNMDFGELSSENIAEIAKDTHILINSTPLGMHGVENDFESFDFLDNLPQDSIVCDLIYNPSETNLLKQAKLRGLKTLNGLGMLIYQALISDKIYTGLEFDYKEMKETVEKVIK